MNVLRSARVVGLTTTGVAGAQRLITSLGPRIVVIEEAAEVMEAHIIAALSARTEHLILIGDHMQARPLFVFILTDFLSCRCFLLVNRI